MVCPPRPEEIANPEVGPGTQNPSHFCDCSFSQTPSSINAPQTKQPTGNATVKAYEASLNPDLVRNDSNRPSSSGEHESNSLQGSQEKEGAWVEAFKEGPKVSISSAAHMTRISPTLRASLDNLPLPLLGRVLTRALITFHLELFSWNGCHELTSCKTGLL